MSRTSVPDGARPQLFVDGHLVAEREGIQEHPPGLTKHPKRVLTAAAPWERPDQGGVGGPVHA